MVFPCTLDIVSPQKYEVSFLPSCYNDRFLKSHATKFARDV